jgi:hypothetical protein
MGLDFNDGKDKPLMMVIKIRTKKTAIMVLDYNVDKEERNNDALIYDDYKDKSNNDALICDYYKEESNNDA